MVDFTVGHLSISKLKGRLGYDCPYIRLSFFLLELNPLSHQSSKIKLTLNLCRGGNKNSLRVSLRC